MADWTFDGVNKIIKEPNVGSGNLTWEVGRDIYSAWKRWVQSGNAQFDAAFSIEGGTPIGATGLFTGTSFILTNGWKLEAGDWDHISFVEGNLFSDDGIDVVPNSSFSASLKTFGSVNAQGISSGSGLSSEQSTQLIEIWRLLGLDNANPVTITPTQQQAGAIDIEISGDGENSSVLTRQ